MAQPPTKPPLQIALDLPADLKPAYANLARIAHAPADFVLDFARLLPGEGKATVTARVIMTPMAVKLFAMALNENIARFESTFGAIKLPTGGQHTLADTLFRPFQPPPGEPTTDPPQEPPTNP